MTAFVTRVGGAGTTGRKMVLSTEDGSISYTVPYAPRNISYDGGTQQWAQIPRVGRAPVLSPGEESLLTLGFDLFLGYPDPTMTVELDIATLRGMALSRSRIACSFGPSEAGWWRITKFSLNSVDRHEETQEITRAVANVELTEASDASPKIGPLTGGVGAGKGGKASWHVVKKGETLHSIAMDEGLGAKGWRLIADANKIRRPKKDAKLKPGSRIKIPAG